MGFAAGFAAGYKAVDDAINEKKAREQKIIDDEKALRTEKSKAMSSAFKDTSDHNTLMSTAQKEMSEATNVDEWNAANKKMVDASNAFTEYAKYNLENQVVPPEAQSLYSKANFGGSEPLVIAKIRDYKNQEVEVPLPQSMASNPENYALMENNKIGIAQVGEDGKIASYQPTDYSPVKFKAEDEYGKGTIDVFDNNGGKTSVTNKQYFDAKEKGTPYRNYVKPEKATIINTGDDKNGERSPVGKAIKDWETYNQEMKTSNPEEYNKQRRQFIEDSFQARVEGVAGVSGEKKNNSKVEAIAVSADILDRETLDNKDINKLRLNQSKIIDNTTNAASRNALVKVETELKGMNATIGQLDRLDTDVDKYIKDDKLKKGLIDNIEQQANEMVGLSEDQKKNLVAIDVNTRLGIIQARFIKLMSGATVSDKEREFYTSLVGTSSWNDETALTQKIKSFSRQMKDDYSSIANEYKNELPHSYYQGTQYTKKTSGQRTQVTGTELDKETPKPVVKEIIQNGWVYNAETKKVIRKAN